LQRPPEPAVAEAPVAVAALACAAAVVRISALTRHIQVMADTSPVVAENTSAAGPRDPTSPGARIGAAATERD
jgi:hypothetical protein